MGKSVCMSSGFKTTTANTTMYGIIGGKLELVTSEVSVRLPWRTAGVISKLAVLIFANSVNAVSTVRLRKNGVNGNSVVSIPANGTGFIEDSVNTDSIAATDQVNVMVTHGAATGIMSFIIIRFVFTPTSGSVTITRLVQNGVLAHNASVIFYDPLAGNIQNTNTTMANALTTPRIAGTFKHFALYSDNTGRAVGIRMIKNSSDDSVDRGTLASGVSGLEEDTASSVVIDNDDTVCLLHVFGGSGTSRNLNFVGTTFETATNHFLFYLGNGNPGLVYGDGATGYHPPTGELINITTNEANVLAPVGVPCNISKLGVRVSANSLNSGTSVTLRKNGVDTALAVTIGSTITGYIENTSDVVNFGVDDEISLKITRGGTSGTITLRAISMLGEFVDVIIGTSDWKDILKQRPQQLITNAI